MRRVLLLLALAGCSGDCDGTRPPSKAMREKFAMEAAAANEAAARARPIDAGPPEPLVLPYLPVSGREILGQRQGVVHKRWGKALVSDDDTDIYDFGGLRVMLSYADGRAGRLAVTVPGALHRLAVISDWLGLSGVPGLSIAAEDGDVVVVTDAWAAGSEKRAKKSRAASDASERIALAERVEQTLLDSGQDATVRARGTTIAVTWVLCSRPVLNAMVNDADGLLASVLLERIGVTRVTCFDGYQTTTSVDM